MDLGQLGMTPRERGNSSTQELNISLLIVINSPSHSPVEHCTRLSSSPQPPLSSRWEVVFLEQQKFTVCQIRQVHTIDSIYIFILIVDHNAYLWPWVHRPQWTYHLSQTEFLLFVWLSLPPSLSLDLEFVLRSTVSALEWLFLTTTQELMVMKGSNFPPLRYKISWPSITYLNGSSQICVDSWGLKDL